MSRAPWMIIIAAAIVATPTRAFADPITILTDSRVVVAGPLLGHLPMPAASQRAGDALVATATMPAGASPGTATATLASSFADPMHWFANGSVMTTWSAPADVAAFSSFFVTFLVTSPVTYAFEGSVGASSENIFSRAIAFAWLGRTIGFDRDNEDIHTMVFRTREVAGNDNDAANQSFAGMLLPGRYQLFGFASSDAFRSVPDATRGSAAATFSFALDFTPAAASPTPEPASLLLLGTGIAGLFGFRARASNRAA